MTRKKKEREVDGKSGAEDSVEPKRRRLRSDDNNDNMTDVPQTTPKSEQRQQESPKPLDPEQTAKIKRMFLAKTSAMQVILDDTVMQSRAEFKSGKVAKLANTDATNDNASTTAMQSYHEQQRQQRITETVNSLMNRPSLLPSANGIGYSDFMQFVTDTTSQREQRQQNTQPPEDGHRGVCELIGNAKQRLDDGQPQLVISFCSNPLFYENDTVDGWGGIDYEQDTEESAKSSLDGRDRKCGVKLCFDIMELVAHIETFRASHRATKSSKKHVKIPNFAYPIMVAKHGQKWVDDHRLVIYLSKHIVEMVEMHYKMLGYEKDLISLRERLQTENAKKPRGGHLTDEMLNIIAPSSPPDSGSSSTSDTLVNKYLVDSLVNPILIAAIEDNAIDQQKQPSETAPTAKDQTMMGKFMNKAYMFGRGLKYVALAPLRLMRWLITWLLTSYVGQQLSIMLARMFRFGICVYKKFGPDGLIDAFKDLVLYFGNDQPIVIFIAEIGACILKVLAPMLMGFNLVKASIGAWDFLPCLYKAGGYILGPLGNIMGRVFGTITSWLVWIVGFVVDTSWMSSDKTPTPLNDAIRALQGEADRKLIEETVRESYRCTALGDCAFFPDAFGNDEWSLKKLLKRMTGMGMGKHEELTRGTTNKQQEEAVETRTAAQYLEAMQARHAENSRLVYDEIFGAPFSVNLVGSLMLSLVKNYTFMVKCSTMLFGSVAVLRAIAIAGEMQGTLAGIQTLLQWVKDKEITGLSVAAEFITNSMGVFKQFSFIGILLLGLKYVPLDEDYDLAPSTTSVNGESVAGSGIGGSDDSRDNRINSDYDKFVAALKGFDKVISREKFMTIMGGVRNRFKAASGEIAMDVAALATGATVGTLYQPAQTGIWNSMKGLFTTQSNAKEDALGYAFSLFQSGQAVTAFAALTGTGSVAAAVAGAAHATRLDGPIDKANKAVAHIKPKRYAFGQRVERFKRLSGAIVKFAWNFISWAVNLLSALTILGENELDNELKKVHWAAALLKKLIIPLGLLDASGLLCVLLQVISRIGRGVAQGALDATGFAYKLDESPAFADTCCNIGSMMGVTHGKLDEAGWKNYASGLKLAPKRERPRNDFDLKRDVMTASKYMVSEFVA